MTRFVPMTAIIAALAGPALAENVNITPEWGLSRLKRRPARWRFRACRTKRL